MSVDPQPLVILCSIDGMRPDALRSVNAPVIHRLAGEGAYTWNARTVMPSVTLPCHTSMLRGVDTPRHGITSNVFQPLARPVPSLLEVAARAGKRVGFFYNWEQLRDLADPGTLTVSFLWNDYSQEGDRHVAEQAAHYLTRANLDVLFLYLGATDEIGHAHGWMSPEYLAAIENADACLGHVLDAVTAAGRRAVTTTLVQSDHGGHGRSHGTDADEDMLIPWILNGPGVRTGHEITSPVRIFDTAPTLAHVLELPRPREWDGAPVSEAFHP
jgi:predicted AlkP superfamily pyrophosphatase or phosphodiesterase